MINIRNGELVFEETHLLQEKIVDFDGIIKRYEKLSINLMIHVVSDPSCRYEKKFAKGRIPSETSRLSAKERFLSILDSKSIQGNPKGYYVDKHNAKSQPLANELIKSVSFAYAGIDNVARHFEARRSKYAFVFFHDFLNNRGIRPVVYVNDQDELALQNLIFNSPHLLEVYGGPYDMRWENEWRIQGSINFSAEDLAFVVVPDNEYHDFIWSDGDQLTDISILPSCVFDDPIRFLSMLDSMDHHAWHQIEILGGLLLNFDDFPTPTPEERKLILGECGELIDCLRKVEIQDFYEARYIQRFLNFASAIDESQLPTVLRSKLDNIRANAGEPYASHRDLMIECYTRLFYIQKERMNFGI